MFGCGSRQSQVIRKLAQYATKNQVQRNVPSFIKCQARNISRKAHPNCRAALCSTWANNKDSNTSILSYNSIFKSHSRRSYATKAPNAGVEVTDLPPLMVPPMPADPTKVTNNIVPQELLSDADILVPISGPVSLFENIFQIIHIDFGLPWWASFAAVTLTLRTAALYVVVPQIRNAALMSCVQPRMSRLMRNIVTAWRQKNYIGRDMYLRSLKMLWASQGVHPARNFVSLLFNIPLFGVYFMAIRDMVKVFPSLSSESVLWLDSLSHADPLHILPFVWSGLLLISFELAIRNAAPGKILQVISWFTRAVCLLAIVFSWNVPSAMFFCWIPSTFFAMLQNYFLTQNRTVRRWFGIPNLPLDRAQITKAMNKQAGSNTQEGGSQPNPLSALKSQLPQ